MSPPGPPDTPGATASRGVDAQAPAQLCWPRREWEQGCSGCLAVRRQLPSECFLLAESRLLMGILSVLVGVSRVFSCATRRKREEHVYCIFQKWKHVLF